MPRLPPLPRRFRDPLRHFRRARCRAARLRSDADGATTLEFALISPIFILMLGGLIEFGLYFWSRHSLEFAMEEVSRSVMTRTTVSESEVVADIKGRLVRVEPESVSATVTTETVGATNFVTINVSYTYDFVFANYVGMQPVAVSAKTRVPMNPPE